MHFSMITLVARSGGERMSLPANYRSRPALVSFFNAFFRATFDRDSDYSFPYGPDLQPGRAAFSDAPPVRYYSLDGEVEREAFTASLIRGLISSGLTIGSDPCRGGMWLCSTRGITGKKSSPPSARS
jgi:hypothetical protein